MKIQFLHVVSREMDVVKGKLESQLLKDKKKMT